MLHPAVRPNRPHRFQHCPVPQRTHPGNEQQKHLPYITTRYDQQNRFLPGNRISGYHPGCVLHRQKFKPAFKANPGVSDSLSITTGSLAAADIHSTAARHLSDRRHIHPVSCTRPQTPGLYPLYLYRWLRNNPDNPQPKQTAGRNRIHPAIQTGMQDHRSLASQHAKSLSNAGQRCRPNLSANLSDTAVESGTNRAAFTKLPQGHAFDSTAGNRIQRKHFSKLKRRNKS